MRRLGYGVIRSKTQNLDILKNSYYCDPHTCTHLSRINETSACAIDKVYKGKMKKT
jgi:hypothetical protein